MSYLVVLDVCAQRCRVALFDRYGRYHVAKSKGELPCAGAELFGASPVFGQAVQLRDQNGSQYELVFEAIDCTERDTHRRLKWKVAF